MVVPVQFNESAWCHLLTDEVCTSRVSCGSMARWSSFCFRSLFLQIPSFYFGFALLWGILHYAEKAFLRCRLLLEGCPLYPQLLHIRLCCPFEVELLLCTFGSTFCNSKCLFVQMKQVSIHLAWGQCSSFAVFGVLWVVCPVLARSNWTGAFGQS